VLEQGKARLLSEALSLTDAALARLPEAERSEVRRLRESLRALEAELKRQLTLGDSTTPDRLRSERASLQARLKTIRAGAPDLLPAGLSSGEILRLVRPGECLVAPLLTAHACAVLILPAGAKHVSDADVLWLDIGPLYELLHPGHVWHPEIRAHSAPGSRPTSSGAPTPPWAHARIARMSSTGCSACSGTRSWDPSVSGWRVPEPARW
jgi:hypothetical protein